LGANYGKTTQQAQMVNLQAHYMLSKRTRLYSQITMTTDAKVNNQDGSRLGNSYSPVFCNSSTTGPCNAALGTIIGGTNSAGDAKGYVVGIVHTF
jgi:predicted porin